VIPTEKTAGEIDPIWNLQILLGMADMALCGWWWANFSGPFRWLVDAQLTLFDRYSELAAGLVLGVALVPALWGAGALLRRTWPYRSARAVDTAVAIIIGAVSVFALAQASLLWQQAVHMPSLSDPLQVVDLDRLGDTALPTGHVRLIGVPDRGRQVLTYSRGRHALGSYWESWIPVEARNRRAPEVPPRIVATHRDADSSAAVRAVPDDPEGLLLADEMDTRAAYEARLEGLDVGEHSLVLFPDDGVRFEKKTNAVLLAVIVLLSWCAGAYSWLTGRASRQAAKVAPTLVPPTIPETVATVAAESAPGARDASRTARDTDAGPGSALSRVGVGAVIVAILSAALLWELMGYLPSRVLVWGYVAAALTFVVALLFLRIGTPAQTSTPHSTALLQQTSPMAELRPPPGAALLCVFRDETIHSKSYKRVDVDGVRIAVLKANRYTVVALTPGVHTLAVNNKLSLSSDLVERFEAAEGAVVIYRMIVPVFGTMRLERTADIAATRETLRRLTAVEPSQ
jgi:hypothetical protein